MAVDQPGTTLPNAIFDTSMQNPPDAFCPKDGFAGDRSGVFVEETRCLLGRRLLACAMILFFAFFAFLLRGLLFTDTTPALSNSTVFYPNIGLIVFLGSVCILLYKKTCRPIELLRTLEVLVFGFSAVFLVWTQFSQVCDCSPLVLVRMAHAFPSQVVIPWILLINMYGLFIPNTWKRSAVVVAAMAVVPLIGAWASAERQSEIANVLIEEGGSFSMILWMFLGSVVTVYGSDRFGRLRRSAFEARRIGSYLLREKLGSGGMGVVYLAEHEFLKRRCAIKIIRAENTADEKAISRFESEVRAAAQLTHPNTIEIYDYGHTSDGTLFYAMEYLPGLNLQEMVDRYGPLPPERVVYLMKQVCQALEEAHRAGMIHRDIKPANIIAAERGGVFDIAKLVDFGLVKSLEPEMGKARISHDGTVVGSPLYSAPETTIDGEPDFRSDIYSIGATTFFLLTGEPVFPGENPIKVLFAHAHDPPPSPSRFQDGIPAELEKIVAICLEKKSDNRFQTVEELGQAFDKVPCDRSWTQSRSQEWWSKTEIVSTVKREFVEPDSALTTIINFN